MTNRTSSVDNADASVAPGLTAYLTPEGAEKATEIFQSHEGYGKYLSALPPVEGNASLYHLRLDKGIYWIGFGSCHFSGQATHDIEKYAAMSVEAKEGFYLGYKFVVRIESDHGEKWQNWLYTEEGDPSS